MEKKSKLPLGLEGKKEEKKREMWKYEKFREVMEKGKGAVRKKQGREGKVFIKV